MEGEEEEEEEEEDEEGEEGGKRRRRRNIRAGGMAVLTILSPRWKLVIRFAPRPLYPRRQKLRYQIIGRSVGPIASSDVFEYRKISCHCH